MAAGPPQEGKPAPVSRRAVPVGILHSGEAGPRSATTPALAGVQPLRGRGGGRDLAPSCRSTIFEEPVSYVDSPFDHDIFVSYSHGSDAHGVPFLQSWSKAFVDALRE